MKYFLLSLCMVFGTVLSHAQIKIPALSTTQTISQDFALSKIELTYSRPNLRGRQMIGDQDPWDTVWRTGANYATKITFGEDVDLLGHAVGAGTYVIYTIPERSGDWTFILNSGVKNWGLNGYQQKEDVFRQKIRVSKNVHKVETLSFQFTDVMPESCNLQLQWEDFTMNIPIRAHFRDRLRKEIETALGEGKNVYYQAAEFYDQYDHNQAKALEMVNKSLATYDVRPFWLVYYKAQLQQAVGDKAGALKSAKESLKLSEDTNSTNYILLASRLIRILE